MTSPGSNANRQKEEIYYILQRIKNILPVIFKENEINVDLFSNFQSLYYSLHPQRILFA